MSRINAIEARADQILCGGANRSADTGVLKKQPQTEGQTERDAEREQARQRHCSAEEIEVGARIARIHGPEIRAERDLRDVGDHDFESEGEDRKSTRLNSSHMSISYAVFC